MRRRHGARGERGIPWQTGRVRRILGRAARLLAKVLTGWPEKRRHCFRGLRALERGQRFPCGKAPFLKPVDGGPLPSLEGRGAPGGKRGHRLEDTNEFSAGLEPLARAEPNGRTLDEVESLRRVGVIDIGSNSVRFVVFDGAARSPAYFYNEKVLCGLGRSLAETGRLDPDGRRRARAALQRFAILAKDMELTTLTVLGTAALREAADGPDFKEEIAAETGLEMKIISGEEEARLSAQGVLLGWPGAEGLVCDIGGASMELAEVGNNTVGRRASSGLAPFRLLAADPESSVLKRLIKDELERLTSLVGQDPPALYLVGGSWRAFARLDMERRSYPLTVLHEYELSAGAIEKTTRWMSSQDPKRLREITGIAPERMVLLPIAAQILRALVQAFRPRRIFISAYGLREGVLFEHMSEALRQADPLIEACRYLEQAQARLPGFGIRLFRFLLPLFRHVSPERLRLVKAACLLHDVNWRTHPDYRAEACFDTATRANLAGIDHRGRVFLGLALMNRYKTQGVKTLLPPVLKLLSEDDIRQAITLGRAMRFGAMLSIKNGDPPAELRYFPRKKILELILDADRAALFGEVAELRLNTLAKTLGVVPVVRLAARQKSAA